MLGVDLEWSFACNTRVNDMVCGSHWRSEKSQLISNWRELGECIR